MRAADAANRPPKRAGAEKDDAITAEDERRATATHVTSGAGDFMVAIFYGFPPAKKT